MSNSKETLRELVPSLLRTGVPSLWGVALAHIATFLTGRLPESIAEPLLELLSSGAVEKVLVAVCILAWYLAWRRFERLVPDWLVRIVLGSAAAPVYPDHVPASPVVDWGDGELEDDWELDDEDA